MTPTTKAKLAREIKVGDLLGGDHDPLSVESAEIYDSPEGTVVRLIVSYGADRRVVIEGADALR